MGWFLFVYPQWLHLYTLIRYGQLFRDLFLLFNSGSLGLSDSRFFDVDIAAISIGPLMAALACGTVSGELHGYLSAEVRRIASFMALVGLLISAAGAIWQFFILRNGILRAGEFISTLKVGVALGAFFFFSWAFFFGILGAAAAPFGKPLTRIVSGVLTVETAAFTLIWIYGVQQWRLDRLFAYAISLAPYVLLCIFAVTTMRAGRQSRSLSPLQ
jgi:hypothetical protein